MQRAKSVDEYISNQPQWSEELKVLRKILLDVGLEEVVKWGGPVYMFNKKNLVSIGGFKSFVSLWFYQGALLKDKKKLLVNAQEGITKAQRQMRFTSGDKIDQATIKAYVLETIENHKAGREIKADTKKPLMIPDELAQAFRSTPDLLIKFEALTLSKRREYAEHISTAKRQETKLARLEKITPMILSGVGLSDKYRR